MQKKTKIIVGAVVVLAVIVLLAAAASGGGSSKAEVRYNYSIEVTDSFTTDSGYTASSGTGSDFAIVTWTVANDSYSDGFSTNSLTFDADLTVNGLTYGTSAYMYSHPGYLLATIEQGHSASFVYVYEVPDGTAVSDIEVSFEYTWTFDPPKMERDESL
ncbi:MAG: hypothetical protein Q4Q62_08555 [Thermoplasmata archaeon]|nr:hypothetical protein [Thermoplasmata archaeon]